MGLHTLTDNLDEDQLDYFAEEVERRQRDEDNAELVRDWAEKAITLADSCADEESNADWIDKHVTKANTELAYLELKTPIPPPCEAFKDLFARLHPELNMENAAQEVSKEWTEAYLVFENDFREWFMAANWHAHNPKNFRKREGFVESATKRLRVAFESEKDDAKAQKEVKQVALAIAEHAHWKGEDLGSLSDYEGEEDD